MQKPTTSFFKSEINQIAFIAIPIAFAQLCQMAMGVTDTILLGGINKQALAVGGLATNIFFTICVILQSALNSSGILIAQSIGAGRYNEVPKIYYTTYIFGLLLCIPCYLILNQADYILYYMGEEKEIITLTVQFLKILLWGMPPLLIGAGLIRVVLPALNASKILLQIIPLMTIVNGLLNAAFIYGLWGFPKMGLNGSALGTTICMWLGSFALIGYSHSRSYLKKYFYPFSINLNYLWPLIKLGLPICIAAAAEMLVFMVTTLRVGLFGTDNLAAHNIALNCATFTFMIPLAIAQAANVRVGYWMGARRVLRARQSGFLTIGLGGSIMAFIGLIIFLFPTSIINFFIDTNNPINHNTILIAITLLKIMALFQVVDGLQTVANGALRGLKDTTIPMIICIFGYWGIGFFVGKWLAFDLQWKTEGLWIGLALGLASVAIMLNLRFVRLTFRPKEMLKMTSK